MNFNELNAYIDSVVTANGQEEITGSNMNLLLKAMVGELGDGYSFAGAATPSTNPGTPDNHIWYLATEAGTYTNFGGIVVTEPTILYFDTAWHAQAVNGNFADVIRTTNIVDNLNSNSSDDVLSAKQGHVLKNAVDAKYTKPGAGIPKSDLDSSVQATLDKADTAVQDVSGKADKVNNATSGDFAGLDAQGNLTDSGKKASDFATASQGAKADTAYQKPSGGIPSTDMTSSVQASLAKADTAYQKPLSGIPSTDMTAAVQSSLEKADTAIQDVSDKQDTLVSGENIKTLNGESLLGSGNIVVATDISGKADKVSGATNGDFAGLDSNGNLTDSGKKASDFQDALVSGTNIKTINNESLLGPGNITIEGADVSGKADKVTNATSGDFAGLDANGNLVDSGKKASDFATAAQGAKADTAIQDVSDKADKVEDAHNGNLAGLDANGNLTDSEIAADNVAQKNGYYAGMAVGLADNLRADIYVDEQFSLRTTGGAANEVGSIGFVQQLKGAGAAIVQMFPEGSGHDFSGDVSLDGTGGNAEAVLRYSDNAGTVEMGYLLAMEAFISQTLSQAQLDAISAKDTGKADRDKAVWLTPAGAITSAPTIESGQTEVTFSGWRIAMRVTASEVRDASASSYWFTSGTKGRQVYDVAVAEGIDVIDWTQELGNIYGLANGWHNKSAMEYLNHMAAQGLPTHQVKAMSALLAVTKIGIKTVKSRNLLNPQTGRALLKAYVNDDETFLDNEYTMLGGLPSGSTMAFTSLLTGKTETLTMLDSTHFVIPSDGWLQITGTLPESIIATWDGTKDNTAADEYATESHVWDVTQLFGTKDGGTEGHYYRFAKEGMRGAGSACDVVELVGAEGVVKVVEKAVSDMNIFAGSYTNPQRQSWICNMADMKQRVRSNNIASRIFATVPTAKTWKPFDLASPSNQIIFLVRPSEYSDAASFKTAMSGVHLFYELATPITFTSLFLSASSTSDELTAMPADAIPLSEIQFADNNWSIEEAIYDAPEADANGVIDTLHQCTGQMRIQYSLDAAESIDTLKKEYAALEERVAALENA